MSQQKTMEHVAEQGYYHFVSASQLAMLYIYPKNEEQELSSAKRSALRTIIENWKRS